MATNNHLQLFAQQLNTWAEQIIENGRTPFRRVDLFHQLQTSAGSCCPPLIFWINRQSMIAGGLIFLPESSEENDYQAEAAAATALGLRHFVTWETDVINVWETGESGNRLVSALPLEADNDPAIFHHRLYEIIDQMKLLSVTGRIGAQDISSYYLLNLIEETLKLSYPPLLEDCRLKRSKNASSVSAEEEADSWNRLSLLRLICLYNWRLIPANLPIDNLFSALEEALERLPPPLNRSLTSLSPLPTQEFPAEAMVAFHHLLLRLQQIGWQGSAQGERILKRLLNHWQLFQSSAESSKTERLIFHSRELAPCCQKEISLSGSQLAANTLWRTLNRQTHPLQTQGDVFSFNTTLDSISIHANFSGHLRPEPTLRRKMAGLLRTSWPNRKLAIPGDLPFWATEVAHLLGLAGPNCGLELHLPANWLSLFKGTFLCELLFANFALDGVECQEGERHLLKLRRQQNTGLTECRLTDGSTRSIELGQQHELAAGSLLYTLELPDSIFNHFAAQQLKPLSETSEEFTEDRALLLYSKSGLGSHLWRLQTGSAPADSIDVIRREASEFGWLVPELLNLRELDRACKENHKDPTTAQIDSLLAQLLEIQGTNFSATKTQTGEQESPAKAVSRSFSEELLHQLKVDGVPNFPKSYLYRQETGPLNSYRFTPPLRLKQEFLGEYEFEDAKENQLHITGEETKEALLLASNLGLTDLELPADRDQTAKMLDSYRRDLLLLQEKITQLCLRHTEQPAAAQRLQKKLWQQLPLPPLKWLSS